MILLRNGHKVPRPTGNATTDTNNIQNAINSFAGEEGGVHFQPGTYICGRITVPSNVTLYRGRFRAKDSLNDSIFRSANPDTGNTNLNFIGLEIDGNASNQIPLSNPCHAIGIYNCTNSSVEDCDIYNTELDGVYCGRTGSVNGISVGGTNDGIGIRNCRLTDIRRNGIGLTRNRNVSVSNCKLINCNLGYREGNEAYNAGAIDIEGTPNEDITISNCEIYAFASSAIQILSSDINTKRITISGCRVYQTNRLAIVGFGHLEDISVLNNVIHTKDAHGIWFNAFEEADISTGILVRRNRVYGDDVINLRGITFNYTHGIIERNRVQDYWNGIGAFYFSEADLERNLWVSCRIPIETGGEGVVIS